jgi:hypothetical protein
MRERDKAKLQKALDTVRNPGGGLKLVSHGFGPPPPTERDIQQKTIAAVVDYLRHCASGYALMRSVKANGARDALYGVAEKLEKSWQEVVLPRTSTAPPSGDAENSATAKETER